jgi:glycosyltransferase involved in cell wall biosynthesis
MERLSCTQMWRLTFLATQTMVDAAQRSMVADGAWPSISVVTPSLNQAKFITETIDSVLGQNYPRLEYFVIDGGSTDGTQEILRRYGDRLRWVSEPDRGQADAVNKGVALARGEIIGWLNSDDTYTPQALEKVARVFATSDELTVVYGDADHIREDGALYGPYPTAAFDYKALSERCFICQPAAFVRRKNLADVGGLDPDLQFCMDYDLWIRMGRRYRFVYLPEVLARSRLHKDAKTLASRRRVFREIIGTVRRHYGFVPFEWGYAYADYMFNRSGSAMFSAHRVSTLALAASLPMTMWMNRRRPTYWPQCWRRAAEGMLHRVSFHEMRSGGRWISVNFKKGGNPDRGRSGPPR